MDWALVPSQIFGGCCLNVLLLECMLAAPSKNNEVDYGPVVSVCQFLLTSIVGAIPLLEFSADLWRRGFLKTSHLPRHKLLVVVLMYFVVSILNNSAWKYGLSVPVHTMFRSSGTVISLVVGYLFSGKKYSMGQVMSCLLMTAGILMVVAQAELSNYFKDNSSDPQSTWRRHSLGISLLFIASVISAFMGLYTENLFRRYGHHWKESFFYLHLFSLPLFLLYTQPISTGVQEIWTSPPNVLLLEKFNWNVPLQTILLLVNAVTQVICSRGVNKLTSSRTALSVTVVLLARKFLSLLISSWIYGNTLSALGIFGAVLLVWGSTQYTLCSTRVQDELSRKQNTSDLKIA